MIELSNLIKVNSDGELFMTNIKRQDGTIVIPGREWEKAIAYACLFDKVNETCLKRWKTALYKNDNLINT